MALTLDEFHRSLKTLAPGMDIQDAQTEFTLPAGPSQVRIVYEALEGAKLGGLLALPRARVKLHLENLDQEQRDAFMARFDKAFQRGGG